MKVYPFFVPFQEQLLSKVLVLFSCCPTDSFTVLKILKEYKLFRFRWQLIDECFHDCFLMINVLFKSRLAIKVPVLRPLRPFTTTKR